MRRGFSLIEMMVVVAIMAVLAMIAIAAMTNLKSQGSAAYASHVLQAHMTTARDRAMARQRTQVVIISTSADTTGKFGFFWLEDSATPPNLFSAAQLDAVASAVQLPNLGSIPTGFSLRTMDYEAFDVSPFVVSADAFSSRAVAFPWSGLMNASKLNTSEGCTFCVGGRGAVAFLPNGRAIFTSGNPTMGMVAFGLVTGAGPQISAVGVNRLGFIEVVEP